MPETELSITGAGRVITELRGRAGISVAELGRRIGVSRSMMSRYESDERRLTADVIERIAAAIDVRPEEAVLACLQAAYPPLITEKVGKRLRNIVDAIAAWDEE
jgi:transcriptional regulator with XRE-family HTH domain